MKMLVLGVLIGVVLTAASLALAGTRGAGTTATRNDFRLCLATRELQKNLAAVAREAQVIPPYQIYRIKGSCNAYLR